MLNSWLNVGGGAETFAYRKIGNVVIWRGLIGTGATDTVVCAVPAAFQPSSGLAAGSASAFTGGDVPLAAGWVFSSGNLILRYAVGMAAFGIRGASWTVD